MSVDGQNIPSINVTDAAGSIQATHVDVEPNTALLSPPSPTLQHLLSSSPSDYSPTIAYPPSPTISTHSDSGFKTTLALRDNQPDDRSSFSLLSPNDAGSSGHRRRPSYATTASSVTEMGDAVVAKVNSCATSLTDVDAQLSSTRKSLESRKSSETESQNLDNHGPEGKKKEKSTDEHDSKTSHQLELLQDEGLDPAPFPFKPYQLAHMLDPKNLDTLTSLGGVVGLIRGLATSADHGLSTLSLSRSATVKSVASAYSASSKLPAITLTEPSGHMREPSINEDHSAYGATFDDRKRVFGENHLPRRPGKSLLQLMWLALKDKVLVCLTSLMIIREFFSYFQQILLSIAAAISLALGLFQDFGTPRSPNQPPVDWVEGVAIMVAIAIVVCISSPA